MDSKGLSHTKWKCQYHIDLYPNTEKSSYMGEYVRI